MAEDLFGEALFEAFLGFCELWGSRYAWDDPESLDSYQVLTHVERKELFRRFAKECRLWEATFRLQLPGDTLPVAVRDAPRGSGESPWRQRLHALEERESRRRAFYSRLAEDASQYARAITLPPSVRDAFLLLGLPTEASLADVRRQFRRLALSHHPDRDGDHEHMARLNRAYREILDHLDRGPRPR